MLTRVFSSAIVCLFFLSTKQAQDEPESSKVLEHFVGAWHSEVTLKPAKWSPEGGKRQAQEVATPILHKRFILIREINPADKLKTLRLMTYDAKTHKYPFWIFNTKGLVGGEWSGTWDEATKTLNSHTTNAPLGWTSQGINRFSDADTNQTTAWMKDDSGAMLFDATTTKTRQAEAAAQEINAAWEKAEPRTDLPPELKVLEPLIGVWDVVGTFKPAEWTPQEVRTTSKVTRKWILDGSFLQDTAEISDGTESIGYFTYDPQRKKYLSWWFNSKGHNSKSTGEWNEAAATLNMKSQLDDGLSSAGSVQLNDKDRHDWKIRITDGTGKVYFDAIWNCRRKE